MQTSKAKFKLQREVTQVLVVQSSFPRTLGDAIRKPHVLQDRKPPCICSRSAHTALTGVTEPRSGRAAFVPARPPVPAERLCLSQPRGPHRFLRRAPAPPPRPRAGLPTYPAHLHRPPASSGLTPAPPGTLVRGRRRCTAARLPARPGGQRQGPAPGLLGELRFREPPKASPGPHTLSQPVPAARLARLSHVCKQ